MPWRERPEIMAWWALARSDLRIARVAADLIPPELHVACFHAQQSAEKSLKALLEAQHCPIVRTHDLARLLQLRPQGDRPNDDVVDACARLTLLAVGPRYPGPAGPSTEDEARQALRDAACVVAWAELRLDQHDFPTP